MSKDWQQDIDDLMLNFGHEIHAKPKMPSEDTLQLRMKLIAEESQELLEALEEGDLPHIAKELADVLVVTIGCASALGIDMNPVWDIVHDSNMAKIGGPVDPETGKQLKPEGWKPPDIESEIKRQLEQSCKK